MAELGSILLRRGTTAERLEFVPLKGEVIYDTELKQVFVGDGETYGGRSVFNDTIVVDTDGTLKVGDNVAVIVGDDGLARSLRLPGGKDSERPDATQGALRFNTTDKTLEFSDGDEWYFLEKNVIDGDVIELYVSLDGTDTRRYGAQRGRSAGTAFRTINAAMREAEDIVNANPETEPYVNEEQPYRKIQVLVKVATGIYEEHLPIRVPPNTSIFGSGQRRCTVRPKAGVASQSPWAKIRFWRETDDHPNGYFGFHYLTDPRDEFSTPKDNTDIDIFLCNDTNWFHDFGTDLHNSFCFVLDPEGQILTKSPYPHTGVCFAKSSYETDPYTVGFHGGMFADGFTGNQDFNIDVVESDGAIIASGFWREPNMPTAFYIDGVRYQADSAESDGLGEEDAAELLRLNKAFIQEETVQYVNDTYLFDYNEDKCRRDLNIILRNVGYDAVLGTNFLTRLTALAYTRPNSAYVLSNQKPQTAGGINYAKGLANTSLTSHTPTQAKNTQLFDDIIDTINNGASATDILYWPDEVYDDSKDSARQIIDSNLTFIKQEVLAWITYQINNEISPFTSSYTYDQDKCARDIEFLVNAVTFDLLFDGNYATKEIANSYWLGITSQIPGQQTQHSATFAFLKTVIAKVLQNNENINWIDKYQLDVPQQLIEDIPAVDASLITTAESLVTIVQEVVVNGTNYAPITEYPNLTTLYNNRPPLFKEELQNAIDARTQLVSDTTTIINSSIAFIDTAYASFTYDEATCRRDVGLIIEAMRHDLIYGGETETVKAAKSYFETGSTVIADQEAETVDAINYARDLAINIVNNSVPASVYQSTITQVQDSTYQAGIGINDTITELFGIITNCITNFTEIKAAHDLLESNKEWIQDEVIAFIADTYPSLTYQTDICRRDTGYIISAISNDIFGGFIRSEEAGRAYYRGQSDVGNTEVVLNAQRDETLAANAYARSLVAQVLANSASNVDYPSSPYQSSTTQTVDLDVTVSTAIKNKADACYNIILDIIGDGGESAGPGALPKFKINISASTPISSDLADKNATMLTAGNKSFVATDWTMFGNLGYGVLARNNARCELVSIFTYYCGYTYKAESGSEVRSLNGSSSNGIYGLGAEGRNPFEVPVRATTLSETAFVAQADSAIVGDNVLGDLQIVVKNAVDVNGDPAEFFNVMVAEVDHGGATGVVRYEIGNYQGNTLNIRGSAQGLLADIPDGNDINIRLLQEYKVSTDQDISQLLLGAALLYDNDPNTGYRIINIEPSGDDFIIRTLPTLNHISVVANGTTTAGSTDITINNINYTEDEILDRRIGYKGTVYKVTAYNGSTTLSVTPALNDDIDDLQSLRLSPAPGLAGDIFTDFSIVKAGNHDMLDIGTGAYEDSNYPRELYGPPAREAVQTQEVNETAPGRVFFVTNDQDGNFRVGDYFRVNQGDGSISFNAAIALSNLDGLGFSRGVTINEFSADSDMSDISDEAVPTEQAVVNYINKRLGQDESGVSAGATRLGAGTLMLDGSQAMEGDIDMDGNDIVNLGVLNVTDITANSIGSQTLDVDVSATIASLQVEDLTNNRLVVAGASGELQDYAELTFDGNTLTVVSSSSTTALDVTGTVNFAGEFNLDGDLYPSGNIIPTTGDVWSLGTEANPWAELFLGPGSLYINGKKVISDETDEITISTAQDQNVRITASGTGQITLGSHTTVPSLGADDITVDDIVIDDNAIVINGNIIRGTGSASSGTITMQPGLTGVTLGEVSVIGNLSVTGTFSTTNTTLENQTITGALTVQQNTTFGTDATDTITIEASLNSDIIPIANNNFDIGSSTLRMSSIFSTALDTEVVTIRNAGDLTMYNDSTPTPGVVFSVDGATGNTSLEGNLTVNNEGNFNIYDNSSPTPVAVFTVNGSSGTTFIRKGGIFRIYNNDASPQIMFDVSGTTGDVYVKNDVDIDGDVNIDGDLTVGGNVLSDLSVEDNTIVLNVNYTGDPDDDGVDAGVEVERGTGTNVLIKWNETTDKWQLTNDGSTYDNIALLGDVTSAAGDTVLTGLGFATGTGVLTATLGDASTITVDLDDRYVLIGGDSMTGTLEVDTITSASANTNLKLSGNGTGIVEINDNLYLNDGNIIFEGTTSTHETTLTKTNPTEDRTITLPDATGTIVVSAGTSSTQSELDLSISAAGQISGSAEGLATSDSPTFAGLTLTNTLAVNIQDSISFESGKHWITYNDGQGNFNIRIGHYANASNEEESTEAGYVFHDEWSQSSGWREFNISSVSTTVGHVQGTDYDWRTQIKYDKSSVYLGYQGTTYLQTTSNGISVKDSITSASTNTDLTLSGNGTGKVYVNDNLDVNGTFSATSIAVDSITSETSDADLVLSGAGDGKVYVNDTLKLNGDITRGTGTISVPNNTTGTIVIGSSNTTTTTQGDLNLTFSISATGTVSATGDAHNLGTGDNVEFAQVKTTTLTTGDAATAGTITGTWSLSTGSKFEATYADVAEIYSTDTDYDPGTVVMFGGSKELTIAVGYATTKVAGVITTNPAFIMNNMAEGQPIALKGRIPVKVTGTVNKGDFIIASNMPGVGIATNKYIGGAIIGKAIEDKTTEKVELIEVKV